MIRIFNSAHFRETGDERFVSLDDVNIVTQKICEFTSAPYILFEHKDFPLGALRAEYNGEHWSCDLDQILVKKRLTYRQKESIVNI